MWIEISILILQEVQVYVTPYTGVWIEIHIHVPRQKLNTVTPYTGVWIEMHRVIYNQISHVSLPTRECGLKFLKFFECGDNIIVTPYTGVWIEIEI